jgi:heme-degrading monooxygenase HmoA
MLIQTHTITVQPGYADRVVERFAGPGKLEAAKA